VDERETIEVTTVRFQQNGLEPLDLARLFQPSQNLDELGVVLAGELLTSRVSVTPTDE
jgi:hypothetical protein